MDLSTFIRVNRPKVIHETIDGEVVMIDFDSGNYFSLNNAGAEIWGYIEHGATLGEIVEGMEGRYEATTDDIVDAVRRLASDLKDEGLIVSGAPEAPERMKGPQSGLALDKQSVKKAFEAPALHKYSDMQELLLLDPIHEVDEAGWPSVKSEAPDEDG